MTPKSTSLVPVSWCDKFARSAMVEGETMNGKQDDKHKRQRGAMALLAAFTVLAMIAFAAIVADVGYMLVTKTELQNVALWDSRSVLMNL